MRLIMKWLLACMFLSSTTIFMTLYMTQTIASIYTDEINQHFHISLPSNLMHVFGVSMGEPRSVPSFSQKINDQTSADKELFTPEKMLQIKKQLTADDKSKIYSLITSKVPPNGIEKLSSLLEDGITQEKLDEMQTILKQYLNDQEYSELISIFRKS